MDLLLVLRGLAAMAVVAWHVVGAYRLELPPVINMPGRIAVWLFFGISGYVIAYGFVHGRYRLVLPDLAQFYWNRFLRLYPLFFSLSILGWLTIWYTTGASPIGPRDVPAQFLAVQFNQDYPLSGVFWTLGIEIHFYLLAPLLVLPLLTPQWIRPLLAGALYAASVYGYRYAVEHYGWSFDGRNVIANLPHFVVGMAACSLASLLRFKSVPVALSLPAAIGVIGYTNWLYHRSSSQFWSINGILLVDLGILLFVVAHARLVSLTRFKRHPAYLSLWWLGTLSYGVYAWHAYVLATFPWLRYHLLTVATVSVVAAYGSYRLIEAPALRQKRHPSRTQVEPGQDFSVQAEGSRS